MKNDQLKFQSEIRSTITEIPAGHGPGLHNPEGSVNKMGASPSSLAVFGEARCMGKKWGEGREKVFVVGNI